MLNIFMGLVFLLLACASVARAAETGALPRRLRRGQPLKQNALQLLIGMPDEQQLRKMFGPMP